MTARVPLWPLAALLVAGSLVFAQPAPKPEASLGEQLYSTQCDSCHTTQVHWREKRIAKDWPSLVVQVRRWQSNAGLGWTDEEVSEVARYLNARYYHFPEKDKTASLTSTRDDR